MSRRASRALSICALLLSVCNRTRAEPPLSFGVVARGSELQPITWESAPPAALSEAGLVLTRPLTAARSVELPLAPLQLYEVRARLGRGPGSAARFAISYLDTAGKPQRWAPIWQLPELARPNWLPLSPHPQTYVQGFVLPPGARQPRVEVELDAPANPKLARYSRLSLSQLRIEALGPVRCCERLGPDRLLGGELETPVHDGFPLGWTQWVADTTNQLELHELRSEPARMHVLRAKPDKVSILASTTPVPVTRGSAWRIAVLVRGQGVVELSAHALTDDQPLPLRVGNVSAAAHFEVRADAWTQLSTLLFAEAAHIAAVQIFVAIEARGGEPMEIDAVELRQFE